MSVDASETSSVPFGGVVADDAGLAELYRAPAPLTVAKKRAAIDSGSAAFIGLSPFLLIGTSGADGGVDVSPRGGSPGFVRVHRGDDGHDYVLIPDLNGNNLIDTLRAVVATGRAGILFVIPGKDDTLRVNGVAWVVTDPEVLDLFDEFRRPRSAIAVRADEVFVHCAKAFRRGRVWDTDLWSELDQAPGLEDIVCAQGYLGDGVDPAAVKLDLEQGYAAQLAYDRPPVDQVPSG